MYVGDWMARGEAYWPERCALVEAHSGRRFTYRQLNRRANLLARWLRDAGVGKGDRVAMLAMNSVAYLDLFFACGKLGAIFVPFNWRLHPREIAQLAARIAPAALFFDEVFRAAAQGALDGEGVSIPLGVSIDCPAAPTYEDRLTSDQGDEQVTEPSVTAADISCLLFTGGTTGLPKAAQISFGMIAWNTLNTVVHELNRDDVTVTHTPLFHTGALLVYTVPLLTLGGTVVLMRQWQADQMLELVESEGVTMFFAVPTQYQLMAESPRFEAADLSRLRFVTSGGAPMPVPLIERWQGAHGVPFKQGFGMTEFGPGVMSMGAEFAVSKAGSIGRPNFFVEARLVDAHHATVAEGQVGELALRGPSMCSGYFDDPQATAEAIDADGWFYTGDLAHRDPDGFYFIVDRKKDMFISGGENVYPAEIEQALYKNAAVSQCAVVGVPDARWGEVGRAFVVCNPGFSPTEAELLAHLGGHLARYKVPKHIRFVDALPVSAAGKILKRELRALS